MNTNKKSFYLAVIAGLLVGFFGFFIFRNLNLGFQINGWIVSLALFALTVIGYLVSWWVSRFIPVVGEIARFVIVGGLNTFIDFGVLNILSYAFSIYGGAGIIPLNIISFSVAVINSYFWNKYWTFQSSTQSQKGQFVVFIAVSVLGALINTGLVYALTLIPAPFSLSDSLWLNLSKIIATFISLVWNFVGYKFIVFKSGT